MLNKLIIFILSSHLRCLFQLFLSSVTELNFTTSNTEHDWCRIRKNSHPSRAPESNTHFFWWGLSCWSFFPFLFCFMCCAYCFLCVRYVSCGQCCLFLDCPFLTTQTPPKKVGVGLRCSRRVWIFSNTTPIVFRVTRSKVQFSDRGKKQN
jgi:hypothetical protein